MKIHKKLPNGTKVAQGWDELSIWAGEIMAKIQHGGFDTTEKAFFDPEQVARRYIVYKSNVPADDRFFGQRMDFQYGNKEFWAQPFFFTWGYGYDRARVEGMLEEPENWWVSVPLKDLGRNQTQKVIEVLEKKGYKQISSNYPLSATQWKKLLGMRYDDIQEEGGDEANAAYETVADWYSRSIKKQRDYVWDPELGDYRDVVEEEPDDAAAWDRLSGVYALTKKGDRIKFIVSRKASRRGI